MLPRYLLQEEPASAPAALQPPKDPISPKIVPSRPKRVAMLTVVARKATHFIYFRHGRENRVINGILNPLTRILDRFQAPQLTHKPVAGDEFFCKDGSRFD